MTFINPEIESSYKKMEAGKHLYDAIIKMSAKKIIDFGVLNGYSTACMAMAAKITKGKVFAYDLFEDYEYNGASQERLKKCLDVYGLLEYVEIKKQSFYDWIDQPENFDILHVDISNTGETINILWEKFKGHKNKRIFFEGGSFDRDKQDWMIKYNKTPFNDPSNNFKFSVLQQSSFEINGRNFYPSISELLI